MPETSSGMKARIGYVDGLRAVAVLSVVIHHAAKYDPNLSVGPLQHALFEGAHGVDLFFVISGFCLSYPVLAKLRAEGSAAFDVARYFAHRFVRILPPYYLAIGFCWLLLIVAVRFHWIMPWGIVGPNVTLWEVFKQMIFADLRPQLLNGSFWSLAVEFRWYFVFPLLLALWVKSPRAFGLVALASIATGYLTRAAGLDFLILPAFMLGIIAADVEIRNLPIRRLAGLLAVLALCVALALEPKEPYEFYGKTQLGWQLASFFFVVAAGGVRWLKSALSVAPLIAIGIASYSIYLIHEPLIGLVQRNTAGGFFAAVLVGAGAGIIFWLLFERPFVDTGLKPKLHNALRPQFAHLMRVVGVPAESRLGLGVRLEPPSTIEARLPEDRTPTQATASPYLAH